MLSLRRYGALDRACGEGGAGHDAAAGGDLESDEEF